MTEPNPTTSRRDFLGTTGLVAAGSALAGVAVPSVHAAEDNTIRVALVGCGGRGTGAAANALSTNKGPIKLVGHGRRLRGSALLELRRSQQGARETRST